MNVATSMIGTLQTITRTLTSNWDFTFLYFLSKLQNIISITDTKLTSAIVIFITYSCHPPDNGVMRAEDERAYMDTIVKEST